MVRTAAMAVVLALALAGCSLYRPLPEPLAPEEIEAIYRAERESYWESIGGGQPMPVVEPVLIAEGTDPWPLIVECVDARGLEGVVVSDGGFQLGAGGDQLELERAIFRCAEAFPPDFANPELFGYLSADERQYLWDYYSDYLVPCLHLNGYRATGMPPREMFVATHYQAWSPYFTLSPPPPSTVVWRYLDSRCAPPPVGDTWRPSQAP